MVYVASDERYEGMRYNRTGRSGLKLPAISLGLWHNFGGIDAFENGRGMITRAFDLGITHFDLANNYGLRQDRRKSCSAKCWPGISRRTVTSW